MIKIENYEVLGWEHVIRGMRNPMNSWKKGDSFFWDKNSGIGERSGMETTNSNCFYDFHIGPNDHELMMKLAKAGPVHGKFRRMITVYVDITAPLYWWKEFDTYKVGTVANSCSTMHKIHAKEFEMSDFSCEHLVGTEKLNGTCALDKHGQRITSPVGVLLETIEMLNLCRDNYLAAKEGDPRFEGIDPKDLWWQMIQLLPSSYNQKRTVQLNYEVLANIHHYRRNHKLDEWEDFCDWIESLPYSEIIVGEVDE